VSVVTAASDVPAPAAEPAREASPPRAVPARRRRLALRGLAILALSLVVGLLSHPWWLAPLLASQLRASAGRDVRFESVRIGLTTSLAPKVSLFGVRIANAPWADATRPFAALDEATFEFAWRRVEGRWLVTRTILRGGEVNLARQADGLRNWRLRDPQDRGPGHYWFVAFEPHDATLRLDHAGIDLRLRTHAAEAPADARQPVGGGTAAALPIVNRIDFDGVFRGVAFRGLADAGPRLTFIFSNEWFGLRGHAETDGARLDLDGRATDLFRGLQADARMTLAGRSLAALRPVLGDRYPDTRDFAVAGVFRAEPERFVLEQARGLVGSTDLAGDLAVSRAAERRRIHAALRSDATELDDLLWLAGRGAPRKAKAAVEAAAAEPAGSRERSPFAGARELDADLAFEARRFHVAAFRHLQSLKFKATLADSALAVSDLDVGWAGGHSTGTLGLDLRRDPAAAQARLETRGIRAETLLGAQDAKRRITGLLNGRLSLDAVGDTVEALRDSARGSVAIGLRDGTLPSLLDAQIGLEAGKLVRTLLSGNEAMALPCAAATIELAGRRAQIRSLVIDTANTRTTGAGSLDLQSKAIDLVLTPEPKRPGLDLSRSIRLSGRLPKPDRALVDRVEPRSGAGCERAPP
jgi:hypothetical protein